MLRLWNPITDGIRSLHPPQEDTLPEPRDLGDTTISRDTLIALSGGQTVDARLYEDNNTWGDPGYAHNNASISSGSLSHDFGEMWRYGCPKCTDWDSDIDMRSVEEEVSAHVTWNMRYVMEGPLWVSVRAFLVPDDDLCLRTTAGEVQRSWVVRVFYRTLFLPFEERLEVRT